MYDVANLVTVALYGIAAIALGFLAATRGMRKLTCVLTASYCGVIIVSFTRGTMGSILLPQVFLYLFSLTVFLRRPIPPFRSAALSRWTYGLFLVYLLAILVGALRYDPNLATTMSGRFQSVGGIPLVLLMAGYRVFVLLSLLLAFSLPLRYFIDRTAMTRCLTLCWLLTVVLAVAGILDYFGVANMKFDLTFAHLREEAIGRHRVIMGFQRGALGSMMLLGIFLSYALTLLTRNPVVRMAAWASAPILIVALLFTWSRAAALGLVVSSLSLVFTLGTTRLIRGAALSAGAITVIWLATSASDTLSQRMTFFPNVQGDGSITSRLDTWTLLLQYLVREPDVLLTGVGFQNFQYTLHTVQGEVGLIAAHNNYLHILTETGVLGLLIFLCWLVSIFWWLLSWRSQDTDYTTKAVFGVFMSVMIGLCVSALTQETLAPASSMVPSLLHFYLILGIWVSWYRSEMWTRYQLAARHTTRRPPTL